MITLIDKEKKTPIVNKRLQILDSLRGLAAMIVCFHHFFKINNDHFKTILSQRIYYIFDLISNTNQEAVIFFFVLSGFSIGLSLKDKRLDDADSINIYIYRRLKRILPIYWIAIALTLVLGFLMKQTHLADYSITNLFGNLLFLQDGADPAKSWATPYGLNGPFWSLSFEFFFYCFFPIAYIINIKFLKNLTTTLKFTILFCLSILSVALNKIIFIPYLAFFSSFIVWLLGFMSSKTYLYKIRYQTLFIGCAVLAFVVIAIEKTIGLPSRTIFSICKGLVVCSVFYFFSLLHEKKFIILLTEWPVKVINFIFHYIGRGSYALYALHYPLLLLLNYYELDLFIQISIVILLLIIATPIEEWTIKWKMNVFKINYCKYFLNSKLKIV